MNDFHNVRFPSRLNLNVAGGPEMRVDVTRLSSGHERRNTRWSNPLRRYLISVGQRPLAEIKTLTSFFEARSGPLSGFLFRDPFDFSTSEFNQIVKPTDVEIAVGDAMTTKVNLIVVNQRQVTHPIEETLRVAIDGAEIFDGYFFDTGDRKLTFDEAPEDGAIITAGFEFDVPVRFENEQLLATRTTHNAGEISDIALLEIRQ